MTLRQTIYRNYDKKIYPRIQNIRGTYRLRELIKDWAITGIPKIDDSKTTTIFEAGEWDNLLILDACRHDVFEESIGKTAGHRYSVASRSKEFIKKTFSDGDYSDVIVVTANPHFFPPLFEEITGRDIEEVFHSVYHTYKTDWDEEKRTVMPDPVLRDFRTARKLFPDKRIIIHLMQPHNPLVAADLGHEVTGFSKYMGEGDEVAEQPETEWDLAEKGIISREEAWNAYRKNTDFILDVIRVNLDDFEGKTMITADHGNLVGENGFYGHPGERKEVPLRKVPWAKLDVLTD